MACATAGTSRLRTAWRLAVSSRRSYRAVVVTSACPATFWTVRQDIDPGVEQIRDRRLRTSCGEKCSTPAAR